MLELLEDGDVACRYQPQRQSGQFGRHCRISTAEQARYLPGPLEREKAWDGDRMDGTVAREERKV
jgi:hypothetical protein